MIISVERGIDPAIHTHGPIPPQVPLPSRLPYSTEQSSLCYTVGPCPLVTPVILSLLLVIQNFPCLVLPNRFSVLGVARGLLVASQSPAQLAGNVYWIFAYQMAQGDPLDIPAYL